MALISITGIIRDVRRLFPSSGNVTFLLSGHFKATDGHIVVPKSELAAVNSADGTFSVNLESTKDGVPATQSYSVSFAGTIDGVTVSVSLGTIQIDSTPATQKLGSILVPA